MSAPPFVESVLHATDFSPASQQAFAHALAVALLRQAELTLVHVGGGAEPDWSRFPAVRETLTRWGLLPEGAPRTAVFENLAVRVKKVALPAGHPADALLDYVRSREPDLLVLATEGRDGPARWMRPSVAQRVSRGATLPSLLVPASGRGFVDPGTGRLQLRRILIPVDHEPSAQRALEWAARAAEALGDPPVTIALLHVGERFPALATREGERFVVERMPRAGRDPVEGIREVAAELDPDLMVLPTAGRRGLLDTLRGSVTERVARAASCPVLAVPSD